MRFGYVLPSGNPRQLAELAHEIEAAGWDGAFYWDGMFISSLEVYDPWVVMAAMAMRTERVTLGAIVSPLSRRRPWKVAREAVTLDHLSNGRLVLPVGLGTMDDEGFAKVGEETDRRVRAELLDESLEIITGLWRGEPFAFSGKHNRVDGVTFAPRPVQRPRIPIWVVAAWPRPKSLARALRYDGILPNIIHADGSFGRETADDVRALRAYIAEHRQAETPFDIVVEGTTPGDDPGAAAAIVAPMAEAGATWWIEAKWEQPNAPDDLRRRIQQGPPRI